MIQRLTLLIINWFGLKVNYNITVNFMSNKKSDGKSDNRYASVKSKAKEFVGNDGSLDKNLVKFS